MKTFQFLVVFILFAGLMSCEKEDSGKNEPHGWLLAGSHPEEYIIGIEDQDAQHGEKSGYIESVSDTAHGFGTLMQWCVVDSFRGKRLRMTGYVQSLASQTSYSMMWVRVDDYDKQITADFDNMDDRPLRGTNYWTKCVIVFDVSESTNAVYYGLILLGPGKAWFDNISFEIVDSSVFKTAYTINQTFVAELPENYPEGPVNLDFEE
jgi:hypothetical protein